jgi:hypothetical protein
MTDVTLFQGGGYAIGSSEESSGQHDVRIQQVGAYALGQHPAEAIYNLNQLAVVLGAAETSNTFHDLKAHQLGVYALVRGLSDRRDLRAWQFPQDDHVFYVLQLGSSGTLVYDKLTEQWCEWTSPGYSYWRGGDGCDWPMAAFNVCIDTRSGKLWRIDPEGRLDYETTPIRSQIYGGMTERFRKHVSCFMAEVALSEGEPAQEGTVGLTLRTGDGSLWVNHGEVLGPAEGEDATIRWYGLGLMKAPGTIFEITDTGYARRIDGLNIEVGE